jgi:hypothetical protein
MLEYWNNGMAPFGQTNAYGGGLLDKISLLRFSIPVFHHSIIPGWKKKNGCLGIPYYQHFVEFPIHINKNIQ